MTENTYGYTQNLGKIPFDNALERVTVALKSEGFGVLTEIDVKATFKKKLDADFRKYKILGACNPHLAHQALSNEILIGLLLPCNVVVYEGDDATITVSVINPKKMFEVVNNPDVVGMAEEVDRKLRKVVNCI